MLEIVFSLVKDSVTVEESNAILNYLIDCNDQKQLVDIMQVIYVGS